MARRKWCSVLGVACLALALVAAACSSPAPAVPAAPASGGAAPPAAPAAKPLEKVTLRTDFSPLGHYAPYWLAYERGYYREVGLDVQIMPGSGSIKNIDAVLAKELDFAQTAVGVFALARDSGRPLRSVMMIMNTNGFGFLYPKTSNVKTVKDLEGKSVIYPPSGPQAPLLPGIFKLAGADVSKVKLTAVDIAGYMGAYGAGQGDAVVSSAPLIGPTVEATRPSNYILWSDVGFVLPDYDIAVSEDMIKQRPDTVRRFVSATVRGWKDAMASQEEAVDALFKNWGDLMLFKDRSVAVKQLKNTVDQLMWSTDTKGKPFGLHSEKEWKIGLETLKEFSGLKGSTDPKDYFTNDFVPK